MSSPPRASPVPPSHAGGLVYRERTGVLEFLLVTARRDPSHWVLPKGHIEPGEAPDDAAVREIAEESGVGAVVEELLADVELALPQGLQRIRYFLLRFRNEGPHVEGRTVAWLPAAGARERLTFADTRELVVTALGRLESRRSPPR